MSMTVSRLAKVLAKLIAEGHGRKPVLVDKSTFRHPLESDGVVMLPVECTVGPIWIGKSDDDGGTKWNRDGTEAGTRAVILRGEPERDVPINAAAEKGGAA